MAVGLVLAFTILWTFAIIGLDSSSAVSVQQKMDGLVVDGNQYVLDTNVDQTRRGQGSYRVIHAVKVKNPRNVKRVSSS